MVLDPSSALYEFEPDYVVLARHEGAVGFPPFTEDAGSRSRRRGGTVEDPLGHDPGGAPTRV